MEFDPPTVEYHTVRTPVNPLGFGKPLSRPPGLALLTPLRGFAPVDGRLHLRLSSHNAILGDARENHKNGKRNPGLGDENGGTTGKTARDGACDGTPKPVRKRPFYPPNAPQRVFLEMAFGHGGHVARLPALPASGIVPHDPRGHETRPTRGSPHCLTGNIQPAADDWVTGERCRVKLSSRSEYGIRALLELAQRQGQGPILSREIAERQDIPDAYLNQLLLTLRKAGIVQSMRGPSGGHQLARSPERVTMAEVIGALEGLPPTEREDLNTGEQSDAWAVRWLCHEIDDAVTAVLKNMTLETLLNRKREREGALSYQI